MIKPLRSPSGTILETVIIRNKVIFEQVKGKTLWSSGCREYHCGWTRFRRNENWHFDKDENLYYSL